MYFTCSCYMFNQFLLFFLMLQGLQGLVGNAGSKGPMVGSTHGFKVYIVFMKLLMKPLFFISI